MRRGVTLIELLITMAIMAIISAAILGTASAAMEAARRDRTRVLVTKIGGLITEQVASYETRRVPLLPNIEQAINDAIVAGTITPTQRGQMIADARLLAVRELMLKEMPDRLDDIQHVPIMLQGSPTLAQRYFRRYTAAQGASNDSAECLYMAVMAATGDGEARTLFAKQDIGDTDEDGANEFVDGWGQPISWLRWPSGVVSDLQPRNADGTRVDHDPLDMYRRDDAAITGPLINSYPTASNFRGTYKDCIRESSVASARAVTVVRPFLMASRSSLANCVTADTRGR